MMVIKTRLFKQDVSQGYLVRQRLLEKMAINHYKPLHLVVAAAGYGKSVFVSQWLDYKQSDYCWISLESDCNDIRTFLNYLGEAVCSKLPSPNCDILEIVQAPELPNSSDLSWIVVNELQSIDKELILVFDDYHLIAEQGVHNLLIELINNLPERHKVIITSRLDPGLNLTKLKAYDKVNEVRMADLRFSLEEINALSVKQFSDNLYEETLKSILELTEGWIVPIRLILKDIAIKRTTEIVYGINQNNIEKVTSYLLEEVLKPEHPMLKESIMQASLFPRFSVELLIRLFKSEHPGEEQKLAELESLIKDFIQHSLFIIALDEERKWFRFHQLIQEFLYERFNQHFSNETINKTLKEGSLFFEEQGFVEEAIRFSVQGSDYLLASDIFDKHRHKLVNEHRLDILRNWLAFFPPEIINDHLGLLLTRAALFETAQNIVDMLKDLQRAEELLTEFSDQSDKSRLLRGEFYSLLTSSAALSGDMKLALESAAKAEDLLAVEHEYLRYYNMAYRILVLNAVGRGNEAMELLLKDRKKLSVLQKRSRMNNHLLGVLLRFDMGQVDSYLYDAHEARKLAEEIGDNTVIVYANYFLAVSAYVKNDLEQVLPYIEKILVNKYASRPFWILHSYFVKGIYLLATGQLAAFESCVIELADYAMIYSSPYTYNGALIMQTELFLRQGNINKARELSKKVNFDSFDMVLPYHLPKLVEVKLLLAEGQAGNLSRADELIQKFDESARRLNNNNLFYQVQCLKVLLLANKNKTKESLNSLREVLSKTEKEGFIRIYTDFGHEMKKLFDKLNDEVKEQPYIQKIIQSFTPNKRLNASIDEAYISLANFIIDDPLKGKLKISAREVNLLIQLNNGLHNKEIAELLHIEPDSVKKALYRLYKKLGVKKRHEAISKVAKLGTLHSSK